MTWTTRLGRLPDPHANEDPRPCETPDCPIVAAPYLARTDWTGATPCSTDSPRFRRLCVKHAAAFAHEFQLPFPAGIWKDNEIGRPPKVFPIPPGTPAATCSSCRETIRWIVTDNGRRMPVNIDGTSHFSTCPNANQHRRERR